jgi:hypothetical protein
MLHQRLVDLVRVALLLGRPSSAGQVLESSKQVDQLVRELLIPILAVSLELEHWWKHLRGC